jgi:hypothetical protein
LADTSAASRQGSAAASGHDLPASASLPDLSAAAHDHHPAGSRAHLASSNSSSSKSTSSHVSRCKPDALMFKQKPSGALQLKVRHGPCQLSGNLPTSTLKLYAVQLLLPVSILISTQGLH